MGGKWSGLFLLQLWNIGTVSFFQHFKTSYLFYHCFYANDIQLQIALNTFSYSHTPSACLAQVNSWLWLKFLKVWLYL